MASRYLRFLKAEVAPYLRTPRKKPLGSQLGELRALWGRYHYPPYHYFKHRLYEQGRTERLIDYFPPALIQRFQESANPRTALRMLYDKLESNRILAGRGLRCIETLFHVDAQGTVFDGGGRQVSIEAAVERLRGRGADAFVKPIDDGVGNGAFVLRAGAIGPALFERASKIVIQPMIANHPRIERLAPGVLNTVRFDTFIDGAECVINAACLKVGCARAQVDNWAKGAIAVGVDLASGALAPRGIRKAAFGRTLHEAHPDTGVRFEQVVLPWWPQALELARSAAWALQPHVTLGTDIAITPDGPIFVEANETGDFFLLQEACGPLGRTRLAERALQAWMGRSAGPTAQRCLNSSGVN